MKRHNGLVQQIFAMLLLSATLSSISGFVLLRQERNLRLRYRGQVNFWNHDEAAQKKLSTPESSRSTRMHLSKEDRPGSPSDVLKESEDRGNVIFALTFAACIWIFSIPPDLRRSHFCTTEQCTNNRSKCYDCVTFSEWGNEVVSYYRKGGGINFDFSVDKNPK
mmetsp:Transcript_5112/g.6939  ORF Transcript_5112/g.6939 Transcript_5112/m.6939 type:complete len:164 (-) Transcript_5112:141-632(-)